MPLQAVQLLRGKTDDTANVFEPFFLQLERHKIHQAHRTAASAPSHLLSGTQIAGSTRDGPRR